MAISGSQKALMACRAGVARSGATRSNYLTNYDAILTIEVGGVVTDFSKYIQTGTLNVTQNLNDEIDTASFTLIPQCPTIPTVRSRLRIGSGRSRPGIVEFAGQIMTVRCEQFGGSDRRPFIHCTCVDDLGVFDSHFVTDVWPTQSVTTTIRDIVTRYTKAGTGGAGAFDASYVTEGLPSVDGFGVANERPSTVIRRITSLIGGAFVIDDRRVFAWGAAGPGTALGTNPVALVDHLHSLKSFARTLDGAQQRTVVFTEGVRTSAVLGVPFVAPVGGPTNGIIYSIPIEDASGFVMPDETVMNITRIGTQMVTYRQAYDVAPAGQNPPATSTTAAAAAGASFLTVAPVPAGWPVNSWARVGNQLIAYVMGTPPTTQMIIKTDAPLRDAVPVGEPVVLVDTMVSISALTRETSLGHGTHFGWTYFGSTPLRAQPQGTPIVLLTAAEDQTAAGQIKVLEQSDGYHEHLVQDGRYSRATALARSQAEVANFKDPLVTYDWATDDVNAKAGRMQHIDLTEKSARIVDDVRIASVSIVWQGPGIPPRRTCRATRVQPVTVIEQWLNETS